MPSATASVVRGLGGKQEEGEEDKAEASASGESHGDERDDRYIVLLAPPPPTPHAGDSEDKGAGLPGAGSSGTSAERLASERIFGESVDRLVSCIRPDDQSITQRTRIIGFLTKLILESFPAHHNIRIIPFGSVPLRCFLPAGDIDIGIFCLGEQMSYSWLYELQASLQHECERKQHLPGVAGDFKVTCVHTIEAEVRVCKCFVDGIEVDITLNVPSGVCTLGFLERIDVVIARKHLFKRSVLLIKAWCYYEARVLGGHNGLISTYALDIMVLFIINKFYKDIDGPLQVFKFFLWYYGNFDWGTYCLTLEGRQRLSMYPYWDADNVEDLESGGGLIGTQQMDELTRAYGYESRSIFHDEFPIRSFNIVDPLKKKNNVGRCISSSNARRIHNAFLFGYEKLEAVLARPGGIADAGVADAALKRLFSTTWRFCRTQLADFHLKTNSNEANEASSSPRGPTHPVHAHVAPGYFYMHAPCDSPVRSPRSPKPPSKKRWMWTGAGGRGAEMRRTPAGDEVDARSINTNGVVATVVGDDERNGARSGTTSSGSSTPRSRDSQAGSTPRSLLEGPEARMMQDMMECARYAFQVSESRRRTANAHMSSDGLEIDKRYPASPMSVRSDDGMSSTSRLLNAASVELTIPRFRSMSAAGDIREKFVRNRYHEQAIKLANDVLRSNPKLGSPKATAAAGGGFSPTFQQHSPTLAYGKKHRRNQRASSNGASPRDASPRDVLER